MTGFDHVILELLFVRVTVHRWRGAGGTHVGGQAEHTVFGIFEFTHYQIIRFDVADLIEIARNETNADLRKNAMFWLGQSSDPQAAEFLAEVIGR